MSVPSQGSQRKSQLGPNSWCKKPGIKKSYSDCAIKTEPLWLNLGFTWDPWISGLGLEVLEVRTIFYFHIAKFCFEVLYRSFSAFWYTTLCFSGHRQDKEINKYGIASVCPDAASIFISRRQDSLSPVAPLSPTSQLVIPQDHSTNLKRVVGSKPHSSSSSKRVNVPSDTSCSSTCRTLESSFLSICSRGMNVVSTSNGVNSSRPLGVASHIRTQESSVTREQEHASYTSLPHPSLVSQVPSSSASFQKLENNVSSSSPVITVPCKESQEPDILLNLRESQPETSTNTSFSAVKAVHIRYDSTTMLRKDIDLIVNSNRVDVKPSRSVTKVSYLPERTQAINDCQTAEGLQEPRLGIEANKNAKNVCIEIKPKQGFLDYSTPDLPLCRYCVKQFLKVRMKVL